MDTEPAKIDEGGDLEKSLEDHEALASLSLPTGVKSAYRPHRNTYKYIYFLIINFGAKKGR